MRVLIVVGDIPMMRALLGAFRRKGHISYACPRGDWALHASNLHSAAPFDATVVGPEFASGSKRRPSETAAEFVARLRERDPLMPVAVLAQDNEPVPFGALRIPLDQEPSVLVRRVVRLVSKIGPRQGSLLLQ